MQWPKGTKVSSLPNFETQARLLRYLLLGQASRRLGIQQLYLGHHQDDMIETILMRLAGSNSGSLACFEGIAVDSSIPIGDELMADRVGPQITGLAFYAPSMVEVELIRNSRGNLSTVQQLPLLANTLNGRIAVAEKPHLSLCRPLLNFSKARILSTCTEYGIPYISDPTNVDPEVTLRNAVRHMLLNHKLPRAISKDRLLKFQLEARHSLWARDYKTNEYCSVAPTTAIDLRSGSLTVRLPRYPQVLQWENAQTVARFLGRFLKVVSPIDGSTPFLYSSEGAVAQVFPGLQALSASVSAKEPASVLTTCKVMLTREGTCSKQDPLDQYYTTWRLSRQPFHRTELLGTTKRFVVSKKAKDIESYSLWSDWLLWDNRYWIKLCGASKEYLSGCIVRPFVSSDSNTLRQALARCSKRLLRHFDALLSDAAPGKERYTLPVIIDDKGIRLFPTLDFLIPRSCRGEEQRDDWRSGLLDWRVIYRSFDSAILQQCRDLQPRLDYQKAVDQYLDNHKKCQQQAHNAQKRDPTA